MLRERYFETFRCRNWICLRYCFSYKLTFYLYSDVVTSRVTKRVMSSTGIISSTIFGYPLNNGGSQIVTF